MIVSFSVSNFRSFSSEETLSLVASKHLSGSHREHAVPIPGSKERVLRTAVLYGANGAGKSNLFKALRYLQLMAIMPRKRSSGTNRRPFRFGGLQDVPSSFDLQFIAANKLYRFGLKVDDERIIDEWLYQVVGGRQTLLYDRSTDQSGRVTVSVSEDIKAASKKVNALATVGGPQNQAFLASVMANLDAGDYGDELGSVLHWFQESLTLIGPEESFHALGQMLDQSSGFLKFASAFLKSASTGVDHLEVHRKEISKDDLRRMLPDALVSRLLRDLADGDAPAARVILGRDQELLVEHKGGDRFYRISIQAAHEHEPGKVIQLELAEESDGTRRLLNLIPALFFLREKGMVYFIDEIDRSLHPILSKEFLEFFLNSCGGCLGQIIVTTHESNLLDQELLRRDEVWFAEKDQTGATRLYSLLDFKARKDLEIRKHYLQGRFGAVPFLGDLKQLLKGAGRTE